MVFPMVFCIYTSLFTCIHWILINDFYPPRERIEDPNIKWSNDLHEPSTYFCHCSWCSDVYSTAEGKLESWNFHKYKNTLVTNYVDCPEQTMQFLLSSVGKTSREHHDCLGMSQEAVMMSHAPSSEGPWATKTEDNKTSTCCRDYVSQLYSSDSAFGPDFTIYQCFKEAVACCSTMSWITILITLQCYQFSHRYWTHSWHTSIWYR